MRISPFHILYFLFVCFFVFLLLFFCLQCRSVKGKSRHWKKQMCMNRKSKKFKKPSKMNMYLVQKRGATMKDKRYFSSNKPCGKVIKFLGYLKNLMKFLKQRYRKNVVETKLFPENLVQFPKDPNL